MRNGTRTLLALFLSAIFILTFIPQDVSAVPYRIQGYLKDTEGSPIPRAEIKLAGEYWDYNSSRYVELTQTTFTDNTGYFKFDVGIAPLTPDGYRAPVTVYYKTSDANITKELNLGGHGAWANLTYEKPFSIVDRIYSPVGLAGLVVLLVVIFMAIYVYKTGKEEEHKEEIIDRAGRRRRR